MGSDSGALYALITYRNAAESEIGTENVQVKAARDAKLAKQLADILEGTRKFTEGIVKA